MQLKIKPMDEERAKAILEWQYEQPYDFYSQVMAFIRAESSKPIRLTVATFNKRAIRLYEKLGFISDKRFRTDSADFEVMVKR